MELYLKEEQLANSLRNIAKEHNLFIFSATQNKSKKLSNNLKQSKIISIYKL